MSNVISYADYIASRSLVETPVGINGFVNNENLFDYQNAIVGWALRKGKAAIFADTGLGKTAMQTCWANSVFAETGKPVLILAPLAVSAQTIREALYFGFSASAWDDEQSTAIKVSNYEQLKNLNPAHYGGIVLDESSILKGFTGKIRASITEFASSIHFRLSCTATPSPNDWMELGTQAEFLGVMNQMEMLAMFFTHDASRTSKWRLKGHGRQRFFEWMSNWAVLLKSPTDLGFDGSRFLLPKLHHVEHVVGERTLTDEEANSLGLHERAKIRKQTLTERADKAAYVAGLDTSEQCLVWCNLNDESKLLAEMIPDSVEVSGSDKPKHKEDALLGFANGDIKVLVTKPRIAGFGMNFQRCNRMIFTGLSDSWEQYYQAVRRCWRFGQTREVTANIVIGADEGAVLANIKRKDAENEELSRQMLKHAGTVFMDSIGVTKADKTDYKPTMQMKAPML